MSKRATIAAILSGCLISLGALGGTAQGGKGEDEFAQADFKLSIVGEQQTKTKSFHDPINDCDVRNYSTGSERVEFESRRPLKVSVFKGPGLKEPVMIYGNPDNARQGIATTAKVTRRYSPNITPPVRKDCPGGGDGGGQPPKPDCGKRTVKPWVMRVEWLKPQKVGLEASGGQDPFKVCPGGTFPELLAERTGGRKIMSKLPSDEVFDRKVGQLVVFGGGERDYILHDYEETTEVGWKVVLKRIKR